MTKRIHLEPAAVAPDRDRARARLLRGNKFLRANGAFGKLLLVQIGAAAEKVCGRLRKSGDYFFSARTCSMAVSISSVIWRWIW